VNYCSYELANERVHSGILKIDRTPCQFRNEPYDQGIEIFRKHSDLPVRSSLKGMVPFLLSWEPKSADKAWAELIDEAFKFGYCIGIVSPIQTRSKSRPPRWNVCPGSLWVQPTPFWLAELFWIIGCKQIASSCFVSYLQLIIRYHHPSTFEGLTRYSDVDQYRLWFWGKEIHSTTLLDAII